MCLAVVCCEMPLSYGTNLEPYHKEILVPYTNVGTQSLLSKNLTARTECVVTLVILART